MERRHSRRIPNLSAHSFEQERTWNLRFLLAQLTFEIFCLFCFISRPKGSVLFVPLLALFLFTCCFKVHGIYTHLKCGLLSAKSCRNRTHRRNTRSAVGINNWVTRSGRAVDCWYLGGKESNSTYHCLSLKQIFGCTGLPPLPVELENMTFSYGLTCRPCWSYLFFKITSLRAPVRALYSRVHIRKNLHQKSRSRKGAKK